MGYEHQHCEQVLDIDTDGHGIRTSALRTGPDINTDMGYEHQHCEQVLDIDTDRHGTRTSALPTDPAYTQTDMGYGRHRLGEHQHCEHVLDTDTDRHDGNATKARFQQHLDENK